MKKKERELKKSEEIAQLDFDQNMNLKKSLPLITVLFGVVMLILFVVVIAFAADTTQNDRANHSLREGDYMQRHQVAEDASDSIKLGQRDDDAPYTKEGSSDVAQLQRTNSHKENPTKDIPQQFVENYDITDYSKNYAQKYDGQSDYKEPFHPCRDNGPYIAFDEELSAKGYVLEHAGRKAKCDDHIFVAGPNTQEMGDKYLGIISLCSPSTRQWDFVEMRQIGSRNFQIMDLHSAGNNSRYYRYPLSSGLELSSGPQGSLVETHKLYDQKIIDALEDVLAHIVIIEEYDYRDDQLCNNIFERK